MPSRLRKVDYLTEGLVREQRKVNHLTEEMNRVEQAKDGIINNHKANMDEVVEESWIMLDEKTRVISNLQKQLESSQSALEQLRSREVAETVVSSKDQSDDPRGLVFSRFEMPSQWNRCPELTEDAKRMESHLQGAKALFAITLYPDNDSISIYLIGWEPSCFQP